MKRIGSPRVKDVFERPVGSGCWWINYYVDGKQHREKVGRRSDALALYQKRKAEVRRKVKLSELVRGKAVTFGQLSEMAVKYAETHLTSPDHCRTKDAILKERPAQKLRFLKVLQDYTGITLRQWIYEKTTSRSVLVVLRPFPRTMTVFRNRNR